MKSEIMVKQMGIDEWVRQRLEQLKRIDSRMTTNLQKYKLRKSRESVRSSGSDSSNEDPLEYDDITDDWRKLKDTLTEEVPFYIKTHTKPKNVKKISTVRIEAERISQKIEEYLSEEDLQLIRFKQNAKKWDSNTKASKLKTPSNPPEKTYEEVMEESKHDSNIFDDMKSVGSEKIRHISNKIDENETYVEEYEKEKKFERVWFRVGLLGVLAFIAIVSFLRIPIRTNLHQLLFDFVQL